LIEEGWTTDRILKEENAEIRRCAIERTGWAMRGGNDVRAVFEKARIALTARPSVVTREQVETFARDVEADTFQLLAGMVPPVRDKYEHAIVSKYVEALRVHLGLPVEEESHD